jgi:hypothetical protein
MRLTHTAVVAALALTAAFPAVVAAEQSSPSAGATRLATTAQGAEWRYKYHNGEWWYWLPSKSWAVHRNGRWNRVVTRVYARYSPAHTVTEQRWPHSHTNGSDMNSSTHAGGAAFLPDTDIRHTGSSHWPHSHTNGSDPYASPHPGGLPHSAASSSQRAARPDQQSQSDDDYKWRNN